MKVIFYDRKELRTPCKRIENFNIDLIKLSDQMYQIMLKENGVGLAANQVGITKRITVIEVEKGQRLTLVNPEITPVGNIKLNDKEGCLSIPGLFANVYRYKTLLVSAQNVFGEKIKFEATNIFARVIQHEIDHLNGILYIDRMNKHDQKRLNSTLKKLNPNHSFLKLDKNL